MLFWLIFCKITRLIGFVDTNTRRSFACVKFFSLEFFFYLNVFGIQSTVCNIALDDPDKVDTKTRWSGNKAVLHPTSVPGALTSLESTAAHRLSNALSSYNINCKIQ